jgi:hypothetical protein
MRFPREKSLSVLQIFTLEIYGYTQGAQYGFPFVHVQRYSCFLDENPRKLWKNRRSVMSLYTLVKLNLEKFYEIEFYYSR